MASCLPDGCEDTENQDHGSTASTDGWPQPRGCASEKGGSYKAEDPNRWYDTVIRNAPHCRQVIGIEGKEARRHEGRSGWSQCRLKTTNGLGREREEERCGRPRQHGEKGPH